MIRLWLLFLFAGCGGVSPPFDASTYDAALSTDAAIAATDAAASQSDGSTSADFASSNVPPAAKSAGYTKAAFDDEFATLDTIDLQDTQAAGFHWYLSGDWFGTTPASALSIVEVDGTTALSMSGSGLGSNLLGAISKNGEAIGTSFTHGAYFEARIAMGMADDTCPANSLQCWPAFWALPNLGGTSLQWPGAQTGYTNGVEMDFMELMPPSVTGSQTPSIHSTLHDWFGTDNSQVPAGSIIADSSSVKVDSTTDAPVFNVIGALWIPSVNGSQGSVQFYLNDAPFGTQITWTGTPPTTASASNDFTPTASTLWTFGASDLFPQSLILGTGANAFMYVDWVRVWQVP